MNIPDETKAPTRAEVAEAIKATQLPAKAAAGIARARQREAVQAAFQNRSDSIRKAIEDDLDSYPEFAKDDPPIQRQV